MTSRGVMWSNRPINSSPCQYVETSRNFHGNVFSELIPGMRKKRRRQWHPAPVLLPGKSHGWRSLVGCSPWVAKSRTQLSDFTFTFHFHALEKEMATHSSVLAWRIPGMVEPGGLPSMGSHRVGHDWSDLAAAVAAAAAWGKSYFTTENTRQKEKPESGGVGTTRLGHSENQPTPGDGRLCGGGWEVLGELWNARWPDDRRRWLGRWLPRGGRPVWRWMGGAWWTVKCKTTWWSKTVAGPVAAQGRSPWRSGPHLRQCFPESLLLPSPPGLFLLLHWELV